MYTYQKRGQVSSQSIILLLAILAIASLLLLGSKSTNPLKLKEDEAVLLQFVDKIKRDIDLVSSNNGAKKSIHYRLPPGYDSICLVDLDNINPVDIKNNPLVKDSVEQERFKNIFLAGENGFYAFYIGELRLNYPHYYCLKSQTKTEIRLEGIGNEAIAETPSNENWCKTAQLGDLCDELDVVLGSGYKAGCCNNFGLCC